MKEIAQKKEKMGKAAIVSVLLLVVIQITQILPNYNYYYSGPVSQPNYLIGIDDQYHLTSQLWKPVDLTPDMLKNWFNYYKPRVGYSLDLYGADITDLDGNRVGLWYSVHDWRLLGSAGFGENNQISVTRPARSRGR